MRFGVVHHVMTSLMAAMGILAVIATGELGRWTNLGLMAGLVVALAIPESWHRLPWLNRAANVLQVVFLIVQIVRMNFFGRPMLDSAVEFAAVLQIVRLATRHGAGHDQHVIVLALIHLIAGTVLGSGLGYGLCFFGFLLVAPGALVLSHLRREVEGNYRQGARDRTGLPVDVPRILRSRRVVGRSFLLFTCSLAVPILLFTVTLFLFFPRVSWSILHMTRAPKGRMVGFDDRVDLGGVGELRTNQAVALYVDVPDLTEPPERLSMHLRGTAFDTFDGKAWSRSNPDWRPLHRTSSEVVIERPADPSRDRLFRFDLDYYDPPIMFFPPGAVSMVTRSESNGLGSPVRLERGPEGQFRYRASDERGLHYEVWVSRTPTTSATSLTREDRQRYLALPPLPERISALARQWTEGKESALERARAIETQLRTDFRYDLDTPSGGTPSPLDHFLFTSKRGHCEYYSSAMAVMLRQVGIPSRNVTGYVGGQFNRFSRNYVVRQRDAHSWVEAFLDGVGWVTFDPTPPAFAAPRNDQGAWVLVRDVLEAWNQRWDRDVIHYDIHRQLSMFERFQRWSSRSLDRLHAPAFGWRWALVAVAVVAVGAAGTRLFLRWRRLRSPSSPDARAPSASRTASTALALYEQLENAMAAQGISRPQGLPPLRHAESLVRRQHPLGDEILDLTRRYLDVRFGGAALSEDERRQLEQRIRSLRAYRPAPVPAT